MKDTTILQRALAVKPNEIRGDITDEDVCLARAWLRGELQYNQVAAVKHFTEQNARWFLCNAMKEAYRRGKVKA